MSWCAYCKRTSISHGGLNNITCHVRVQVHKQSLQEAAGSTSTMLREKQ